MSDVGGRPPKLYRCFGVELSLSDWAEVSGVPRFTIRNRMKDGWTITEALVYLPGEVPPGRERSRAAHESR